MPRIDQFLVKMVETGASDLHLTSSLPPMLRLHGSIMKIQGQSALSSKAIMELVYEIMPERNRRQFEETRDTDFAYELENVARFRTNVFADRLGVGTVMRVIPSKILTAEQLNLPRAVLDFCYLSKGFVVVTGPTGSGKSTTLAAMVDHINKNKTDHIITVEDPIEFVHESQRSLLNQREIGVHTRNFKSALKAALREDPNTILVGEMRDLETIAIAIEMAETGHLVFGTLHTTTAASTIDRIIDQFPSDQQEQIRTMLSGSLKGVVAQTLLKRCDKPGRVAAIEVLVMTSGVANQIREGKTFAINSAIQTGAKLGMVSLNNAILEHVVAGRVAPEEAYIKSVDKQDLLTRLMQAGVQFDPSTLREGGEPAAPPPPAEGGAPAQAEEDAEAAPAQEEEAAPPARSAPRKEAASFDDFESFRQQRSGGAKRR